MDCVFCAIINGKIPSVRVHEDERTLAFMDINPLNDGHLLVVPKAHAETIWDLGDDDARALMSVARRIAHGLRSALQPDGLNLMQSNGRAADQIVMHVHLHLIPRWTGDGKHLTWEHVPGDLERIRALGARVSAALSEAT